MSDTPRTDAAAFGTDDETLNRLFGIRELPRYVVPVDFTRQLERELAAVTADLCTFAVDMEKQLAAVTAERDALSAIVQSSYQLFQSIADEDDAGHFQINHNLRRRLDALCHEIKTTT